MRFVIAAVLLTFAAVPKLDAQTKPHPYGRLPSDPIVGIINAVPSFGGIWIGPEGMFHASLAKLGDSLKLRASVETLAFQRSQRYHEPVKGVVIEKAIYPYAQLYDWQCKLEGRAFGIRGVQSASVDEFKNKVRIGVYQAEAVNKVLEIAKDLSIPSDAVSVEIEGKLQLDYQQ